MDCQELSWGRGVEMGGGLFKGPNVTRGEVGQFCRLDALHYS